MFTGLVKEIGIVQSFVNGALIINCKDVISQSAIGDSISVNGVCLTVTKIQKHALEFQVSPTTMKYTRLNQQEIKYKETVNLEPALTLNTPLGGHLVTGHIDGLARIVSISKQNNDNYLFELQAPQALRCLIAKKGSVTIDGISLTVAEVSSSSFELAIIAHTYISTNLHTKKVGDNMHIEADLIARYVFNILNNNKNIRCTQY